MLAYIYISCTCIHYHAYTCQLAVSTSCRYPVLYFNNSIMSQAWKKVVVFLGTTREGRFGLRVANFVVNKLKEKNLEVTFVDPLEFELPLLVKPVHFYRLPDKAPQNIVDMNKKIEESDAIVVISAEYNHSIPPALSNTLDYFSPRAFSNKPSGIITYSLSVVGGARAGVQLRSMLGELGCISVSNMFTIPTVSEAFTEDGVPKETDTGSHMLSGMKKLLDQLEWWANAAKIHRNAVGGF